MSREYVEELRADGSRAGPQRGPGTGGHLPGGRTLGLRGATLYGLLPDGYTIFDNLLHLALGVASIAVALFGLGRVAARG